jgi:hypothetical protein
VGKIQERCCQGRSESSSSQRAIVAAEASVKPRSMTSRCSSAREKRESGTPCARGSSQATAFTWAISSGGKTPRAAGALQILDSLDALLAEAFSPAPDGLAAHLQALSDLGVGLTFGCHQHKLGSLHLTVGAGVAGGEVLQLGALGIAQVNLVGAASRHRPPDSLRSPLLLQAGRDFWPRALRIVLSEPPGSGDSYTFTVRRDPAGASPPVSTTITCTVTGSLATNNTCEDTKNSQTFSAGDGISILATESNNPTSRTMFFRLDFQP